MSLLPEDPCLQSDQTGLSNENQDSNGDFGFPFPADLIAFWDFSEREAPYFAKAGVDQFPLQIGGTAPAQVEALPFGKGLKFNGSSDYLKLELDEDKALNVAKSGDEVTVVAWVNRPTTSRNRNTFIAGMWQEDDNNPKRQYGLFASLPMYGGDNRVCGHVSKTGGASPNLPYSRDYSACGAVIGKDIDRCIGFTYDGCEVKSYVDGIADIRSTYTEPDAPNGEGLTYSKNPYFFDLGLNRTTSVSDFTVGAVKLTPGMGNFFDGVISGLAVFRRALTPDEMMTMHTNSLKQGDPIQHFDTLMENFVANHSVGQYGWEASAGQTAEDCTNQNSVSGWAFTRIHSPTNKSFAFVSSESQSINETRLHMLNKTGMKGINLEEIGKVEFTLNNKGAGNEIHFCIKVDGQWYATSAKYTHLGDGSSGADWSTGVVQSLKMTRDQTQWLLLDYDLGTVLNLGSRPTNHLPNSQVTGVGLLAEPLQPGSIIRVADIKLFR
ncbi:MAG TPA: hypothetical protein VFT51_15505 [Bacillales bacterium]|nr:hypothetical protein [Bacillales bacterium]